MKPIFYTVTNIFKCITVYFYYLKLHSAIHKSLATITISSSQHMSHLESKFLSTTELINEQHASVFQCHNRYDIFPDEVTAKPVARRSSCTLAENLEEDSIQRVQRVGVADAVDSQKIVIFTAIYPVSSRRERPFTWANKISSAHGARQAKIKGLV